MMVSRREFVGGALAFGAFGAPRFAAAAGGARSVPPRLRFGVVSDVHIGGKPDAEQQLEKALRLFRAKSQGQPLRKLHF